MKIIFLSGFIAFLVGCSSSEQKPSASLSTADKEEKADSLIRSSQIDSLKWYFYAYTYKGKAIFKHGDKGEFYNPVECDVKVDSTIIEKDSLTCTLSFYKQGLEYLYVKEGSAIGGFTYTNGIAVPLTGMIVLDNFDKPEYVRKDNKKTDSLFRFYLKNVDTTKLAPWLLVESRKRGVL